MASKAQITQELMDEFGKSSIQVRERVERVVGEVTIDILSQNDSRFRRLSKSTRITLLTTDTQYKLPGDMASVRKTFTQVDVDNVFIREVTVVDEIEFFRRKSDASYTGKHYAYVETITDHANGPGEYLIINAAPTATGYYKVPYYRKPTENDTDIIINTRAIKEGCRASFPNYVLNAANSLVIYEKMKSGIVESPDSRATNMVLAPNKQQQGRNRQMRKIGRGQ